MGKFESVAYMACTSVIMLPLIIPTIIYAYDNEDNDCQEGRTADLNLSEWLKVVGFTDLGILILYWTSAIFAIFNTDLAYITQVGFTVISFISKFFIWAIGMAVVCSSENNKCVGRGESIGILGVFHVIPVITYLIYVFGYYLIGMYGMARDDNKSSRDSSRV